MRDALLSSAPDDTSMRSRATCISTMMSERNGVDNWLSVPFRRNPTASQPYAKQKRLPAVCLTTSKLMEAMSVPIPQPFSIWRNGQPCWIISNGAGMPTCLCAEDSQKAQRKHDCRSLSCHGRTCAMSSCFGAIACWFDRLDYQLEKAWGSSLVFYDLSNNHIHHVSFVCCC